MGKTFTVITVEGKEFRFYSRIRAEQFQFANRGSLLLPF